MLSKLSESLSVHHVTREQWNVAFLALHVPHLLLLVLVAARYLRRMRLQHARQIVVRHRRLLIHHVWGCGGCVVSGVSGPKVPRGSPTQVELSQKRGKTQGGEVARWGNTLKGRTEPSSEATLRGTFRGPGDRGIIAVTARASQARRSVLSQRRISGFPGTFFRPISFFGVQHRGFGRVCLGWKQPCVLTVLLFVI